MKGTYYLKWNIITFAVSDKTSSFQTNIRILKTCNCPVGLRASHTVWTPQSGLSEEGNAGSCQQGKQIEHSSVVCGASCHRALLGDQGDQHCHMGCCLITLLASTPGGDKIKREGRHMTHRSYPTTPKVVQSRLIRFSLLARSEKSAASNLWLNFDYEEKHFQTSKQWQDAVKAADNQ